MESVQNRTKQHVIVHEENPERFEEISRKLEEPISEDARIRALLMDIYMRAGGKLSFGTIFQKTLEGLRQIASSFSQKGNGRMGILTYAELRQLVSKRVPFLVEDFIPSQSVGILVGEWGIGKSPLAIQLQQCLCSGKSFLNRFTVGSPIPVLYIDMENGGGDVFNTGNTIAGYLSLSEIPELAQNYGVNYSPEEGYGDLEYLQQLIQISKAKLVIIDPLRAFSPKAPTDNEDAIELIQKLRKIISKEGCSILILHHPNKPRGDLESYSLEADPTEWFRRASGVAALVQNVDFRIGLEKTSPDSLTMRHFIRMKGWYEPIKIQRERDPDTEEPIGYRPNSPVDSLSAEDRGYYDSLSEYFETRDLKRVSGLSDNPVNERLKTWTGNNLIKNSGRGKYKKVWGC